ncbi:MAG: bifunctional riboflavin kinase/FAD synthetase [Oscillospiraceae bacterium]|jgi:riboflavin kinase/FMN adenylyltransferase|nr:bifunctional riboflavin kinase/FAD synthetase [Oscillospiraceae bacterium]
MEITSDIYSQRSTSVALGQFDALHKGHIEVIKAAKKDGIALAIFTFKRGTLVKSVPGSVTTSGKRIEILENLGADLLCEPDFEDVRNLTPEEFVRNILVLKLKARFVTCGYDYRFGKNAEGTAQLLSELCRRRNVQCTVVPPVLEGGVPVSSTEIKRLLDLGEPDTAAAMLGRYFSYDFTVVGGQRLGRTLGSPTINQYFDDNLIIPKFGVYASMVQVEGKHYHSVTNIGVRPTVGSGRPLSETFIADFDGDLYGQRVEVFLLKYMRDERKFESLDALKNQIALDAQTSREIFSGKQ